jgi:NTP pyrophosphatase (non-canonical NTP hydrolase)
VADAPYRLTITELVDQSYKNSSQHGFWDDERTDETIPSKLALIMSEAGEALESYRNPNSDNLVPIPVELVERLTQGPTDNASYHGARLELNDLLRAWQVKPKGFDIELADIMIRVADLAGALGIDLESAVQKKHAYNLGRPFRHNRKV